MRGPDCVQDRMRKSFVRFCCPLSCNVESRPVDNSRIVIKKKKKKKQKEKKKSTRNKFFQFLGLRSMASFETVIDKNDRWYLSNSQRLIFFFSQFSPISPFPTTFPIFLPCFLASFYFSYIYSPCRNKKSFETRTKRKLRYSEQ